MRHIDHAYFILLLGSVLFLAAGIACIGLGGGVIAIVGVTLVVLGFGALGAILRLNRDSR